MAIPPHKSVKPCEALTRCAGDFSPTLRWYRSTVVVAARALSSEAVELIAAERITASNKPTIPWGK